MVRIWYEVVCYRYYCIRKYDDERVITRTWMNEVADTSHTGYRAVIDNFATDFQSLVNLPSELIHATIRTHSEGRVEVYHLLCTL